MSSKSLSSRAKKRAARIKYQHEHKKPKKPNESPGFSMKDFNETEYYFEEGCRKVKPYYYTWSTFAKGRWIGRTVKDVFSDELMSAYPNFLDSHLVNGSILVNGKPVSGRHIFQHNDLIKHRTHRHEPPVPNLPIEVIHNSENILVVNKPPGIPVHPSGRYRYNTVVFILGKEHNFPSLLTIYRLDAPTSGLLIFAKNSQTAREAHSSMIDKVMLKEYLAIVEGSKFPRGQTECNEPIMCSDQKIGVHYCSREKGKHAQTIFRHIASNESRSLIKCIPRTGRTHQIRVHLQYMGFPIINDNVYNTITWGPEKGKNGNFHTDISSLLIRLRESHEIFNKIVNYDEILSRHVAKVEHSSNVRLDDCKGQVSSEKSNDALKTVLTTVKSSDKIEKVDSYSDSSENGEEISEDKRKPFDLENCSEINSHFSLSCSDCLIKYKVPSVEPMYLHAYRYTSKKWSFFTNLPKWVKDFVKNDESLMMQNIEGKDILHEKIFGVEEAK